MKPFPAWVLTLSRLGPLLFASFAMIIDNPEATIRIKNLRLRTYIGINEDEIRNRQDVVINACIRFDGSAAFNAMAIDRTLNYRTITKDIIAFVEENRFFLLEKMTHDVLMRIMAYQDVRHAEVEIDKPYALRFSDSVSIALSAQREDDKQPSTD